MNIEILKNEVLRIIEEFDPECPDSGAYLNGHCSLFELVMNHYNLQQQDSADKKRLAPACVDCEIHKQYCAICEAKGRRFSSL